MRLRPQPRPSHMYPLIMDVYPVILAGGTGATGSLYPLNESLPKALLPVGNHPLIYYTLQLLDSNNFKEVTVIVNGRDYKSISWALDSYQHIFPNSSLKAIPFELPSHPESSEEGGSATALNALRATGRVKSDLLVLSCDVISTVSLHHLWERHVTLGSSISILLVNPSIPNDQKPVNNTTEQDLIGLTNEGQVVFHSSLADVEDELKLSKRLLTNIPHFKMHSNLLDSHVYIISKWVLDYMSEHLKHCLSFKREVLPYLIKHQQSKELQQLALYNQDSIDQLALRYSSYPFGTTPTTHPIQCHAHTITEGLCMRVNTIPLYMEANRIIFQHFPSFLIERNDTKPNSASGDSVISEATVLPERSSVKRSMIGRHCVIGEKVKIINSIVMDHVTIGEGCILQNTILCNHAHLEDRVILRDCTVGSRVTINSKAEHKGELLVEGAELDF